MMSSSPEQDLQGQPADGSLLKPKKWTRVCGRKVKTGCRTCKIRRIKCDEQRPDCLRCRISGRKCDGYTRVESSEARSLQPSNESYRTSPLRGVISSSPIAAVHIHTEITGAQYERRAFHHFRVRTADDLSGYFPSNFWSRVILQLGHSEPAIKHAVIAVATAHENYQAGSKTVHGEAALDLQQYNKAIVCLKQHLSVPSEHSTEVALICCALFIMFESLRGNYEAALIHLQSGIDIIKSCEKPGGRPSSTSNVPYLDPATDEEELIELFRRLDFSASAFVPRRPPLMTPRSPDPNSKKHLHNLCEARQALERLVNRTIFYMIQVFGNRSQSFRDADPQPSSEQKSLLAAVSAWSMQFDKLLKSPQMTNLSGKGLLGAFTLILHKKTISVMLQTCHLDDPSIFAQYAEDIESIVAIAAFVASPSHDTSVSAHKIKPCTVEERKSQPPKFTSDMGIIAPLHYILLNSRQSAVRQRAIQILTETPRREGIWDSKLIAEIVLTSIHLRGETRLEDNPALSIDSVQDIAQLLGECQIPEAM